MSDNIKNSERVLILAPLGRDAALTCGILSNNGFSCHVSADIKDLVLEVHSGAAAILITEEVLTSEAVDALRGVLDQQPDWSDLPVFVLVSGKPERTKRQNIINALGPGRHISILERPASASSLVAVLHSAVKSRERQYQIRTLLRKLELTASRLEESNRALQDFAHIASHDLHEPLRKIETFGKMLTSKYGSALGDEGKDYLSRMQNAASRMKDLIKNLLEYARLSSKGRTPGQVNLKKVVQEILSDLEVRIAQINAHIEIGDLPEINADGVQMRQLFQNLISNALKFHADAQPSIAIFSQWCTNGTCEIRVRDNGIGFNQEFSERIFAPFQRLHGRSQYEGTGIGLAICRKIVERHGGTIRAESSPGNGAAFIVNLPVGEGEELPQHG
jgi:signal transduction histidine kinase